MTPSARPGQRRVTRAAVTVYPHAATGVFAAKRRNVIGRNVALLPAYSLMLGVIALFGYMARATPA